MKFANDSERRSLTDAEKNDGILWLRDDGYKFIELGPGTAFFFKEDDGYYIRVNEPKSGWWVTVEKFAGKKKRIIGEGHSFGACTTVQEAIEDAKDAIANGDGVREKLVKQVETEMIQQIHAMMKHEAYVRRRQKMRNRGRRV